MIKKKVLIVLGIIFIVFILCFVYLIQNSFDNKAKDILGNASFKLFVNISKKELQIGDPFQVYVKLYSRNNLPVSFSGIDKSNIKNALLIKSTTKKSEGEKITISYYTYYLQSDSLKQIEIPSVKAKYKNTVQKSKPILITPKSVLSKDVKGLNDIKNIDQFFILKLWYLLLPVFALLLIVLGFFIIKKIIKKVKSIKKPQKIILPHDIAFEELNRLKNCKLASQKDFDVFHTKLSEIIRKYLEGRFNIKAVEKTTEELLPEINNLELDNKIKQHLKHILKESDLVKFAQQGISIENSYLFLDNTIEFVTKTMIIPENINNKKDEEYVSI